MKINFIGIGAQKCASTWVHRVLSDHPEALVYPGKEIDFFSTYYDRGYQWYENQFTVGGPVKAVGEVSTSYFADADTPLRVKKYNPDMKVVLSLRDPIERAYSNHLHEVRIGHYCGDNLAFEEGLKNNPMYLDQSRYAKHLARWLAVLPRNQLHVVFQEDIRNDPAAQSRRLYQFLDLDESHQSWYLDKRVNESRSIKNSRLDHLLKRLGRLGRLIGAGQAIELAKKTDLLRRLKRANQTDLRQVIPPMLEETRQFLRAELADDMLELAHQLNMDTFPWASWHNLPKAII